MTTIAGKTGRWARVLGLVGAASLLLSADRAQAQFGGDYVRYSVYGGGPYGYGSRGYYKAATPEPHYDVRARDYAGDLRPVYHGSLPMSATESYTRTSARLSEYDPTGRGVYGPYRMSLHEFGVRRNVYGSQW